MDRRDFLFSMTGAGFAAQTAAAQSQGRKTHIYKIDYFYYRQGSQATRLHEFLSSQMPLLTKHSRTAGVFTAVFAPRTQTTMMISGFTSFDDLLKAGGAVEGDDGYRKGFEQLEQLGKGEPPFDNQQRLLLTATDFSPEYTAPAEKPKSPRYFELRVYHSPTVHQLHMLMERFSGAEVAIFHRSGIHPVLYANGMVGPDLPNLTYFMPFATLEDREKAWDAFGKDPEWLKVRAESVAKGGQIVDRQDMSLWRATAFSPMQ